ncbi:MAG: hypothetical protein Q9176_007684 [Flavoplaca citrina]
MMLSKILFSLLLSAPTSAKYLTITAGSSDVTTTQCRTLLGVSSMGKVPTYTFSRTALLPEVELVLAVSTPGSTVTPPAVTATDTLQTYTTMTITASTATGTFSTTTTVFETDSITTTDTIVSTTTSTTTATGTSTHTEPAPSDWINVKNSTGLKEPEDQAVLQGSNLQQPLQDSHTGVRGGWPPKIPKPPGLSNPWAEKYPLSVTCKQGPSMLLFHKGLHPAGFRVIRTRYIKMIIFVKPYTTTTTIPPATSTTTSTQTISSTSTVVPDSVTVIESFSTTSTTTTTLTSVVTDTSTATERVNATLTTTSYAACGTDNLLGPALAHGWKLAAASINDYVAGQQDVSLHASEYDCCVSCLLDEAQNCQYSVTLYYTDPPQCGRLLNPAICRGQDYEAGEIRAEPEDDTTEAGQLVSNGPCGVLKFHQSRYSPPIDQPPPVGMVEL